jgi:hypothetical protein
MLQSPPQAVRPRALGFDAPPPFSCEAEHDLVFARAREPENSSPAGRCARTGILNPSPCWLGRGARRRQVLGSS